MHEALTFEKSCGAVVFCRSGRVVRYLLVCERSGFWVFPKGHMEAGESERETALREIREETGLDVSIVAGFRAEDEHSLAREGRPNTIKQTVYFLAEYRGQTVIPQQSEISDAALLDFDSAMDVLQLDSFKRILTQANDFLTQNADT